MYGEVIKQLMKEHSFDTVYELAKVAGITPIGLSNIVNNKVAKPNRNTLEKLSVVFGMTVVEFKNKARECK